MLDWFRSWHGAPTDDKWLVVARRAGVPALFVPSIAWAFFDHASQADERGDVSGFDFETYAMKFNVEEEQVRAVYAAMEAKAIIVSGRIAQWEKRQPKREDNSSDRMRKVRKGDAQGALPLTPAEPPQEAAAPEPPDISATESTPEAEPLITPEAYSLSREIARLAGHDIEFVPPAWCGAPGRVQAWLTNGWPPEIILPSVKAQMHRKRDGPPDHVQYFEKGIARAIAEQSAPLPNVVPFTAENIHARVRTNQSPIAAAADRLIAELEGGDGTLRESAVGLLPDGRR